MDSPEACPPELANNDNQVNLDYKELYEKPQDVISESIKSSPTNQPQATSIHSSVKRAKISSTLVCEGNDELKDLGIEVYDQHTYERGVIDQVEEAIAVVDSFSKTTATTSSSSTTQPSNLTDLIQLIHDQPTNAAPETQENCDSANKDQELLQLTRRQRLNNATRNEKTRAEEDTDRTKNLPKVPKLTISLARIKVEPIDPSFDAIEEQGSTSRVRPSSPDQEDLSTSEDSSGSDYQPLASDASVHSQEEEYETDGEIDLCSKSSDESVLETAEATDKSKKLHDDGDIKYYQARMKSYNRKKAKMRMQNISDDGVEMRKLDETVEVEGDLVIPKEMWENLFEHQRTGVKWLWELHQLGTGGILGDEMGLGKTIQMIAFLTAIKCSHLHNMDKPYEGLGPTVLVCPATVMHQWLAELRKWWPPFRVAILHSTGSFIGDKSNLVRAINKAGGILIVSYPGAVIYQEELHSLDWHYAILDEGHKIRNPDAQVTLACKRFRTPHRLILSGSPVQNNLKELWSIFDFIFPGKLGTLPVFMEQFGIPITQGGYANASDIQVQIAYKCSCVLRDTIKPFLLRRTKAEVNNKLKLPERSEQVLFCKLTDRQRKCYQAYLDSPTIRDIKSGFCQIFVGLIELRKICNHPDLFDSSGCQKQLKQQAKETNQRYREFFSEDESYGHFKKSGKMMVVDALLKLWKKQNHKVLLFTQSRQMLKIFSRYLDANNYPHLTMDGTTPIGLRQSMIEKFNTDETIFLFLLTTRVGGVGVNLIGANRIIIYDPDWNPSTDIQARERAWRIGQQRHVIIYRLLTAGTIEEKIYHRQVFKLYLTNRVLKDVKQKRFFKTNDLHELFTLGHNDKDIETKALFDEDLHIKPESLKRKKSSKHSKKRSKDEGRSDVSQLLSDDKLKAMRDRVKYLSKMIAQQYGNSDKLEAASVNQPRIKVEPGLEVDKVNPNLENPASKAVPIKNSSDSRHSKQHLEQLADHDKPDKLEKQGIDFLVRQDVYKPCGESKSKSSKSRSKQEDYILGRLFKNSNISGALKHDKIETDSTADFKVVESEAEKVARDAIRALRESRRLCLDSRVGVPNWTGRNGQVAAAPRSGLIRQRRGPVQVIGHSSSSSGNESLLSAIKKRNHINPVSMAQTTFNAIGADDEQDRINKDFVGKADGTGAQDMADKLRAYLLFSSARRGEAQTDELLRFFNENFKPDKTPIFKAILYKMCEFQRRGDKGFWLIRSEFRDL